MVKKMLIEATHPEENRVVVVEGTRLEEFDVETSTKKQLKGNIYLAKVIRVEPSLQAAFVDYGNERHGFLPFSEIHPDYYQIPVADREELKKLLMERQKADAEADEERVMQAIRSEEENDAESAVDVASDVEDSAESVRDEDAVSCECEDAAEPVRHRRHHHHRRYGEMIDAADVETIGGSDSDAPRRSMHGYFDLIRNYKIQEVIHRNQILLVQVVKEERGNKGAALTTYLSLAGRYCVLMPNNASGGGVSRKISNIMDRRKLKDIVNALPVPEGMSVIVRTAGRERTKLEIRRDYEYLIKSWMQIRDMTMASVAPCLIHEEGNLIRRSIRDLYTPDIAEVLVEGDEAFENAKNFMKMIIPSHAKKVIKYRDKVPLFHRYQVDTQLEALHNPVVQLKSGGYLVINPTEALVAIDVNSGRSTREHSIEETALKTNLEAVEEVARQFRLRDLAGIIVIDLIDMDEPRNRVIVERRMREILRHEKARIQIAKINGFGLMEISRQRLHSSFIETSYHTCPYCQGSGVERSIESISVRLLRVLEDEAGKGRSSVVTLTVPPKAALYLLNHKRCLITDLEKAYDVAIEINSDDSFVSPIDYRVERQRRVENTGRCMPRAQEEDVYTQDITQDIADEDDVITFKSDEQDGKTDEDFSERRHGRGRRGLFGRRRGRHNDRRRNFDFNPDDACGADVAEGSFVVSDDQSDNALADVSSEFSPETEDSFENIRRRKRGHRRSDEMSEVTTESTESFDALEENDESVKHKGRWSFGRKRDEMDTDVDMPKKPKGAVILFSSHARKAENLKDENTVENTAESSMSEASEAEVKPARRGRKPKVKDDVTPAETAENVITAEADETPKAPKHKGWWSRKSD